MDAPPAAVVATFEKKAKELAAKPSVGERHSSSLAARGSYIVQQRRTLWRGEQPQCSPLPSDVLKLVLQFRNFRNWRVLHRLVRVCKLWHRVIFCFALEEQYQLLLFKKGLPLTNQVKTRVGFQTDSASYSITLKPPKLGESVESFTLASDLSSKNKEKLLTTISEGV